MNPPSVGAEGNRPLGNKEETGKDAAVAEITVDENEHVSTPDAPTNTAPSPPSRDTGNNPIPPSTSVSEEPPVPPTKKEATVEAKDIPLPPIPEKDDT